MIRLLLKDLEFSKLNLAIWGVMLLLLLVIYQSNEMPLPVVLTFGGLTMSMLPVVLLAQEDRFKSMMLSCSLPVRRTTIVQSKYVGAWLVSLAGCFVMLVVWLCLPSSVVRPEIVFSTRNLLTVLATLTLMLATLLPFAIRFGFTGLMVFMVGAQLLGVLAMACLGMMGRRSVIVAVITAVAHALSWWREVLGDAGFTAACIGVLLLFNLLSYRLSVRLFRNKDL